MDTGIKMLFNFLSSYFMADHICIHKGCKIYFEKIHKLSRRKDFLPIDLSLVDNAMNAPTDFFYVNQLESLISSNQSELAGEYSAQRIKAAFACKIAKAEDGEFIILRVDSTIKRIWQHGEMDIYITTAKVLEMLYNSGRLVLE